VLPSCAAADADLTDDVPPDGWNSLDGTYAFRYVDPSGTKPPLLVKALSVSVLVYRHLASGIWLLQGPSMWVMCRRCPRLGKPMYFQSRMISRLTSVSTRERT